MELLRHSHKTRSEIYGDTNSDPSPNSFYPFKYTKLGLSVQMKAGPLSDEQGERECSHKEGKARKELTYFHSYDNSKSPKYGCFLPLRNKIKPLSGYFLLNSTLISNIWS